MAMSAELDARAARGVGSKLVRPECPAGVTLLQFTISFAAFGAALVWALIAPELGPALDLGRTQLTIWSTTFLLLPALVLYMFRSASQSVANLAHLFWTFAWLIFLVHAYWAIFVIFEGVADTFRRMGTLISSVNFFLTGLWTLDVLLLWTVPRPPRWLVKVRLGTRIFTFLIFAITLVGLRGGSVRILGFIFVGSILVALLLRGWAHVRRDAPEPQPA